MVKKDNYASTKQKSRKSDSGESVLDSVEIYVNKSNS